MGASEESVIRRVCALWATADADAMAECFAPDGVYRNVPAPQAFAGREAVRAYLRMVFGHVGVEAEVLHLASEGEWVLHERVDTHVLGDRRLPLPVMNVSRVVDGEVALWKDYYDQQTVVDLGLV